MLLRTLDCVFDTLFKRLLCSTSPFDTIIDNFPRFSKAFLGHTPPFVHDGGEAGIADRIGTGFDFGQKAFHKAHTDLRFSFEGLAGG